MTLLVYYACYNKNSMDNLNIRNLFVTIQVSGKTEIKVTADLGVAKGPASCFQVVIFSVGEKRGRKSLFIKALNSIHKAPSSQPNYFSLPNTITLGLSFKHTHYGEAQIFSSCISFPLL